MISSRVLSVLLLIALLITAGCSFLSGESGAEKNITPGESQFIPGYQITIAQPDARSDLIRMDTDVYNPGEVVEFSVVNTGILPLECSYTPPDFRVIFQTGSGSWATRMGPEVPVHGNTSYLQKGESTKTYRFVTDGWSPGRYRIVSDCGVERDIFVRSPPVVTPVPTTCPVTNNVTGPWIQIDPIGDQTENQPFTIRGTTNLPAGEELRYSIFSVQSHEQNLSYAQEGSFSTFVEEGSCGTNTWNAAGEIQMSGEFFIGISDMAKKAVSIKRFNVLPQ